MPRMAFAAACLALSVIDAQAMRAADYDSSHSIPGFIFGSALISTSKGHVTDAMARIDRQLASDPHNGNAHFRRGLTLMRMGLPAQAVGEFRIVMGMRPEEGYLHVSVGWALLVGGQTDAAIAEFVQALKMHLPLNAAVTYGELSLALEKRRSFDDAITTLASAFKATAPENAWDFLAVRCNLATQIGLLDAAAEACDASITQRPRNAFAFEGRGLLDLKTKQWPRAIADYGQVLYLSPDDAFALYGRSLARRAIGDSGAAADRQASMAQEPAIAEIFGRSYDLH